MNGIHVAITVRDLASQPILDLLDLKGSAGYKIVGVAASEAIKSHLAQRDQVPHPKGWPKTHFNDRARQQTFWRSTNFDATVHIALVGFGTYYTGKPEVIRPVNAKLLTIPARAEAYGRRAREFSDLEFAIVPNEKGRLQPALVRVQQTLFSFKKGKDRKVKDVRYLPGKRVVVGSVKIPGKLEATNIRQIGGEVFFWLAKSVRTKPHPEALPTRDQLREAAVRELGAYVESL